MLQRRFVRQQQQQHQSLFVRRSLAAASSSATMLRSSPLLGLNGSHQKRSLTIRLPEDQSQFVQYQEIELPTETRIDHMRSFFKPDTKCWVALEKVHGSNFGMYLIRDQVSGEDVMRFAKRSGVMDPREHFFGYHILIDQFTAHAKKAREILEKELGIKDIQKVVLHGELFGLKYDHPQVPQSTQVCKIPGYTKAGAKAVDQIIPLNRVQIQEEPFPQYSPNLHFYCFDIKYSVSGADSDLKLLNYDQFVWVSKQIPNFIYAKALVRGTLDECVSFDIENFQTPLPAQLGLGNYPMQNNWAEGIIVRHIDHDTEAMKQVANPACTCLKLRCSAFMELKHPEKQVELKKTFVETVRVMAVKNAKGESQAKTETLLPQLESTANELLVNYVSEGRLSNVLSKYGRDSVASGNLTKAQLTLYLAKDALKDFLKELESPEVLNMGYSFRTVLATNCYREAAKLVDRKWDELKAGAVKKGKA